ncbi:hypothetical protein ACQP0C_00710 [Nocardia sp. CA-129566]|uniref:hypothetical protein n=1 Tax=Nocardia sp. CA-129566 TaxID=3239976 RepID=UPI003D9594E7
MISALRTQAIRDRVTLMSPESLRVALSRWENNHTTPDDLHTALLCRVLELERNNEAPTATVFDGPENDTLYDVLAHHTNSLRLLDRRLGAPAVRSQTASHVTALEKLWHSAAGADRRSIARAQADTAALAAWQDFDVGDCEMAAKHYAQARQAASRAGDPVLLAHAIGEHAVMLAETGRPSVALRQVTQAEAIPRLPPLLRSWLAATHAQVSTFCPGEASSARSALAMAETDLALVQPGDEKALPFLSLNTVHLQRWQGHVLVRLGDPAGTHISQDALRELPGEFVRAQSGQVLDLAEGALRARNVDEANSLLTTAAMRIGAVGSARLRRRHDLLARRVRQLEPSV